MGRDARIMPVGKVTGPLRRVTGDTLAQTIRWRRRIIRLRLWSINVVGTVAAIVGNGGSNSQTKNASGNRSTRMVVMVMKIVIMAKWGEIMVMMPPVVVIPVMAERNLHRRGKCQYGHAGEQLHSSLCDHY